MNPLENNTALEAAGEASARTCGVPIHLSMLTTYSIEEKKEDYEKYVIISDISVACANAIALTTKATSTVDAYDTQGGLSGDGSLNSLRPHWFVRPAHTRRLKAIAKRFQAAYKMVLTIDISFRVKRCRGNTYVGGKCLVCYAVNNIRHGSDEVAAWFDITQTESATNKNAYELTSDIKKDQARHTHTNKQMSSMHPRLPRSCASCKRLDTREDKHRQCPCKEAFYCGRDCQRTHWDQQHKVTCTYTKKQRFLGETKIFIAPAE
jgi:hypothetical protein